MEALETFWNALIHTPAVELIAVLTGISYVILAAQRVIWCWLFAFISSALYVYICIQFQLYIESVLQLFFVVMAVVGWISWMRRPSPGAGEHIVLDATETAEKEVQTWGWKINAINVLLSGLGAFLLGWSFDTWTDQANPYMDAFTTVFSLVATFMVTRKVLENWIYWVVIDIVAVALYAFRGLNLTALLYAFFTVLALFGFFAWYKQFKLQSR